MGQVMQMKNKAVDERDHFDALREKWKRERLPDGELDVDGAMFLAVWALIVLAGTGAFLTGAFLIGYYWL